jgi:hypothetical protein
MKACPHNPPLYEYIADWVDQIINNCDAIPNDIMCPSELKYANKSKA